MSEELVIKTNHVFPPIPVRAWDWEAWFDGYDEGGPIGRGRTEQVAIDDLLSDAENSGFLDWYEERKNANAAV